MINILLFIWRFTYLHNSHICSPNAYNYVTVHRIAYRNLFYSQSRFHHTFLHACHHASVTCFRRVPVRAFR